MNHYGETKRTKFKVNIEGVSGETDPVRAALAVQRRTHIQKSVQSKKIDQFANRTNRRVVLTDRALREKELAESGRKEERHRTKTEFESALEKLEQDYSNGMKVLGSS